MKKIILAIVAIVTSCSLSFADTTLESAYEQLSSLPGMSEKKADNVKIGENTVIRNFKSSTAKVDSKTIGQYRDKFVWMTENLPVRNMVIGANNRREMAAVYATPTAGGDYTVLIFKGNAINGDFNISYGQTTPEGIAEINDASVAMDNAELTFTAADADQAMIEVTAY